MWWSARRFSQTVLVFKLAHNGPRAGARLNRVNALLVVS
jgi:hypothetical protein